MKNNYLSIVRRIQLRIVLFYICVFIFIAGSCCAQDISRDSTADSSSSVTEVDTILFQPDHLLDSYTRVDDSIDYEHRLSQNPTVALFKSMILPGWGQVGNGKYIKAAVYLGLDTWFVGAAVHYGRQASDFRSKFETIDDVTLRNEYFDLYRDRRDERNKFTWFAVIVTFVSMFDAYADAHLSGFPEVDRFDRRTMIGRDEGDVGLIVSINF